MAEYLRLFTYIPYAVFAVTVGLFVLRLDCRWWTKAFATLGLAFGCSIFLAFRHLGHASMSPEFPAPLIWFWSWAYCGAMTLAALAVLCWFRFWRKGVVLPLVAWGVAAWGLWNGVKPPEVRELELAFADLPAELDGYRLVHLSDFHASSSLGAWRTRAIVERVNALKADLVCLTGDYGDGNAAKYHDALAPIEGLRARDGVWAVTGNHDWFPFHAGWWPWYEKWGLRFLENACVFPRPKLALGGVNDPEVKKPWAKASPSRFPDVCRTFAAATNGEFRILLDHQPADMRENLTRHGVRLQLSGHTHGGIMPGMATIVKRLNGGFLRGLYREGDSYLHVTTGCGQGSSFLMRFFDPTEIVVITLRRREQE